MSGRRLPTGIKLRRGRYQARWRDPGGVERSASYETLDEAVAHRTQMIRSKNAGTYRDLSLGKISLDGWMDIWWPTVQIRPSTQARDESYFRNHVRPAFGTWPINAIGVQDVQTWIASLSKEKGLAPGSIHKVHQMLGKALQAAVADGRIVTNPCRSSVLPTVPYSEARFLSADELLTVEDACHALAPHWAVLIPFLADTGLRIGEASALRVADVDLTQCCVHVRRTAVEVRGTLLEGEPKTAAGRRTVPMLSDETAELLARRITDLDLAPSGHLFAGTVGGQLRVNAFRARVWTRVIDAAAIQDPRPTIHSLRHTAVAHWIAAGVSDGYRLARWAGHRDVATIYRIYGHLLPHDASTERAGLGRLRTEARARRLELEARGQEFVGHTDSSTD